MRDSRIGSFADALLKDLEHSLRSMIRTKGTTALAIGTLALGISAATLIFSIFYSVLLAPLPFRAPQHLVQLWERRTGVEWSQASFSTPNFWDVRAENRTFESIAAFLPADINLTGSGDPQHLSAAFVSANFLHTLGLQPVLGRDFETNADQPNHQNSVLLLSHKFWSSRYNSSASIIGSTLHVNGAPYTVIGIAPAGDPWLNEVDLFLPLIYDSQANRGSFEATVIGRLAPGVSLSTAQADLTRIAHNLSKIYRKDDGMGILVSPSSSWGPNLVIRRALAVLLGAVLMLLLIACVNVANLLLAKATARARELRIREALGASHARLIRLVLTESLLLAGCGATVGLFLVTWGLALLRTVHIENVPSLSGLRLNFWILSFTLLVTVLSAVLAGVAPAFQTTSRNLGAALREDDRTQTAGTGKNRLRSVLVSAEVALAMILLVGAGLLIRSFGKLMGVERGFSTKGRAIATLNTPAFDDGRAEHFTRMLLERIRSLPGVRAAATVNSKPIVGWDPGMSFAALDSTRGQEHGVPWASWRFVSTGYFRTMGISLLAGRDFSDADFHPTDIRKAIVSAAVANLLWPGQNPIGRRIVLWKGQGNKPAEVVGVVANTRDHGLDADPTRIVYLPGVNQTGSPVQLIVESTYAPASLASTLRAIVASIEPGIPVSDVQTLDSLVTESLGSERLNLFLLSGFALLALLLTLTGIYGVLAYSLARRTQELGIRLALGASSRSILQLVFLQGMRPIFFGIILGAAGSLALTRTLSGLLFQIQPEDLSTYVGVTILILAAACIACYMPAVRALRVDPVIALRQP